MLIQAESKFSTNDNIFVIKEKYCYADCKKCSGTGKLELVIGGDIACDNCNGRKKDYDSGCVVHWEVDGKYKINDISVRLDKTGKTIIAYNSGAETKSSSSHIYSLEDNTFATLEEAQFECEKRGERFEDNDE